MWSSLTIKRAFWLLDVVLVACIALLAVQIFNAFMVPPPDISSSIAAPARTNPAATSGEIKPAEYYAAMSNRRIFGGAGAVPGTAGSAKKPVPSSLASLPITALRLKLLGTAVGTEGMSNAVIANETSRSIKVYKEGDKVAPMTIVEQILAKKVILNRDGNREVLTASVTTTSSVAVASSSRPGSAGPPSRGRPGARPNYTVLERDEWAERDPYKLLGDGKLNPVWREGRVEGLQVTNIERNEHAQRLGIKEGDILVSVNGVKIRSVEEGMSLASKLQQAPVVRAEIMRDGKPQILTFRLR